MVGRLCILLHAHLPFVRHPEHARFLEENWLFEAITETYVPLLRLLEAWDRDGVRPGLTITLSPTLCAMLRDGFLQERYVAHLGSQLALAEKELHRTHWEPEVQTLAQFYRDRLEGIRAFYEEKGRDLVRCFGEFEARGAIEIITTSATHAVLPLLAEDPEAVRAQVRVAADSHRESFGRGPRGIWLPECAYKEGLEDLLREAGLQWFVVDAHGLLQARPRPVFATFAPVLTLAGVAVFGRDAESAQQVWSRHQGYPGDFDYRDFYRDIGFDLDWGYVAPHLASGERRSFTGFKYHRITGKEGAKALYRPEAALQKVRVHAQHFLKMRAQQIQKAAGLMRREAVVLAPYDAELFGHWWYEGPEFLDAVVRGAREHASTFRLSTPGEYLSTGPALQVATPGASSWGEAGYWRVWLNEENEWIYRAVRAANSRMRALLEERREETRPQIESRALRQAGRELLLAQASDWPFIIRAGTSPEYARQRVREHLENFRLLGAQVEHGEIRESFLSQLEQRHNLFPNLNLAHWRQSGGATNGRS